MSENFNISEFKHIPCYAVKFESHEDEKIFSQDLFDELCETYRDRMPGGIGDDTRPEDVDPHQLFMGVLVEFEHTHDPMTAMEIALDHLTEIPDYYDRLEEMEDGARDDGMLFENESKPLTESEVVKSNIDPATISSDVYNKLAFILKRKGWDVRGGLDIKELMMGQKARNAFNAKWIEELNKIIGNEPKPKEVESKSDKSILSKAVKELGITRDPSMGGYILPNGLFLDLSEGSNRRTADHRTVEQFMPDEYEHQSDAMYAFMEQTGCIRWMPESHAICMRVKPTPNQIRTIKDLVQSADDSIPVDFYSSQYGQEGKVYPKGTSWQKIIGDINRFYAGNELSNDFLHEAAEGNEWFSEVGDYTVKAYHGSEADITSVDFSHSGSRQGKDSGMMWFTSTKENADYYGDKVYSATLKFSNLLAINDMDEYRELSNEVEKSLESGKIEIDEFEADSVRDVLLLTPPTFPDVARSIKDSELGFDGVVFRNVVDGYAHGDTYVVFDPDCIQEITPLTEAGFYPPRKPLDTNSHRMHVILATLNMYKAMSEIDRRKMENQLKEAKIAVYVLQRYSDDFLIKLKAYANELRESEMTAAQLKKRPASKDRIGEFENWKKSETKKFKSDADDDMKFFRDNGYLDEDGKFK